MLPAPTQTAVPFQIPSNSANRVNNQRYQRNSGEHQNIRRIIQQEIRQEMRRFRPPQSQQNFSRQNQYNNRNVRSTTAQIYCTICNRYGHSSYTCRRANYQADPRIPNTQNTRRNWQSRTNFAPSQNPRGKNFNSGQQQSGN